MITEPVEEEVFECERYEMAESPRYQFDLNRRGFMQVLGAGLVISSSGGTVLAQRARRNRDALTVAARLHIGHDGKITVMTSKVEAGQGSRQQLTQAAAEELRVPVEQIEFIMADTALVPDDGGTAGSRTTPSSVPAIRRGAAAARRLLIELACKRWQVVKEEVEVENGVIRRRSGGESISYGDLAQTEGFAEAWQQPVPRDVELTPIGKWKVLGTSSRRPNVREVVTGAHQFPSDILRPGMLYGKVLRPPSYGATLTAIDLSEAQAMADVVVVRDGEFVGCAAPTSYRAGQAVEALAKTAQWKTQPHPASTELYDLLKRTAEDDEGPKASVARGLAEADRVLKATYEIAYVQHVPMEPRAGVAEWSGGELTAWTGSQQPSRVRRQLAEAFHLAPERVRVIVPDTGGGFGGKHTGEAALEAARLAKAAGKPVSLRWTREEEFTWAYFRPAGVIEVQGGLDAGGKLVAWDQVNINSGGSAIESPYAIEKKDSRVLDSDSPLRQGSYRALASTANTFARESFMDELADVAGADPLDFRLSLLENARLRDVLEAAVKKFQWKRRKGNTKANVGVGLACGIEKRSYVAACVEVAVDRQTGKIKVGKVVQAYECGAIQNPDNLQAQVEGCIIMGLGPALTEEMHFENGSILNPKLSQYQVPRFKDVPSIETVLLDRRDLNSVGAGETPIIAIAPAIANAVYDATGLRLRSMPMRTEALKKT